MRTTDKNNKNKSIFLIIVQNKFKTSRSNKSSMSKIEHLITL